MIVADTVQILTNMNTDLIAQALGASGYKDCRFKTAKFLGITNGNQFCYSVTFREDDRDQTGKVFVGYDSATGFITADF